MSVSRAARTDQRPVLLISAFITACVLLTYANTFRVPFLFDDIRGIQRNPTLAHLSTAFHPPENHALSGRPIANVSFALNRALSGDDVWSYHAFNLAIHLSSALLLFGAMRRTLRRVFPDEPTVKGAVLAGVTALWWALHPLQTEAVTFLVQRVESLMALFYLLTLYAFIRATTTERPLGWHIVSVAACALGMATKEVMVSAPLIVWLYDRTFVSGTFRTAMAKRWGYYACLGATWIVLAGCIGSGHGRITSAGPIPAVSPWHYLVTQGYAIPHYLRLALWPAGQVFDYGYGTVPLTPGIAVELGALAIAFGATVWAIAGRHDDSARSARRSVGFAGAWFFAILAPSSSIVPLTLQTIAEHRMYLPLAAPVAVVVVALRCFRLRQLVWIGAAVAVGLGAATAARNTIYEVPVRLWLDTTAKRPENARAWGNLGHRLANIGHWREAIAACKTQLQVDPRYTLDSDAVIGWSLLELGHADQALPHLETAARKTPDAFDVRSNLGMALAALGRTSDAIEQYAAALQLNPDWAEAHGNLANALVTLHRYDAAWPHYAAAAKARPDDAQTQLNWAASLVESGNLEEAVPHFHAALALKPDMAAAHLGLGDVAAKRGRVPEAIAEYQAAVRIDPKLASAENNLAIVLMQARRVDEAIAALRRTVELRPDSAKVHYELAIALAQRGNYDEARTEAQSALHCDPTMTEAKELLASLDQ